MQKVTSKNTKNEILDAYEGLLKEVKTIKQINQRSKKLRLAISL